MANPTSDSNPSASASGNPSPTPDTQPVVITAVGGGTGLSPTAAKGVFAALNNGALTGDFLSALQIDAAAINGFLPTVAAGAWTSTSAPGGVSTSTITNGVCTATVAIQPLSPEVREQFNPGDEVSSYMISLQLRGQHLWGGNTYFVGFNGLAEGVQLLILQELQTRYNAVLRAVADAMARGATVQGTSIPARGGELTELQQEIHDLLSASIDVQGMSYAPAFAISAGAAAVLGCVFRTLGAAFANGYAAVPVAEGAAAAAVCDIGTCLSTLLFVVAVVLLIVAVVVAIIDFVSNTYYHTLITLNLTQSTDFQPTIPTNAVDNALPTPISGSLQDQTIPRLCLAPCNSLNGQTPMPCMGMSVFTMSNQGKSTTLEGFNYLALFQAINADAPVQNVAAVINIPRFGNNSIAAWVNAPSTDYAQLLAQNESAAQQLSIKTEANGVIAILTMSALQGVENDQYASLLVISDPAGLAAFQNWSEETSP